MGKLHKLHIFSYGQINVPLKTIENAIFDPTFILT